MREAGETEQLVLDGLRAVDDRAAMRPDPTRESLSLLESLTEGYTARIGVLAAVQLKYERPVLPGVRLDYRATLGFARAGSYKADVEASVDGMVVASGSLTTVDAR